MRLGYLVMRYPSFPPEFTRPVAEM